MEARGGALFNAVSDMDTWKDRKSVQYGNTGLNDGLIEFAMTHGEIEGAFLTFQKDADQMLPGWREELTYTGESTVQGLPLGTPMFSKDKRDVSDYWSACPHPCPERLLVRLPAHVAVPSFDGADSRGGTVRQPPCRDHLCSFMGCERLLVSLSPDCVYHDA
jgi:hypothetical protein